MYAMDMRQYDPAIARWVAQDPVVHYDYSTYNSFDNNPIFFADPSGADSEVGNRNQEDDLQKRKIENSNIGGRIKDYFDKETGEFLGRGGTDDIKFIERKFWDLNLLGLADNDATQLSDEAFKNVLLHYVGKTDKKIHSNFEIRVRENTGIYTGYDEKLDLVYLAISKDRIGKQIINRFDAINMHEHESFSHGNDWRKLWFTYKRRYDSSSQSDFDLFESNATNYQIKTSSWKNTSKQWNSIIYDHYGHYVPSSLQKKYFPNYTN